jgi:hypothetical protein
LPLAVPLTPSRLPLRRGVFSLSSDVMVRS